MITDLFMAAMTGDRRGLPFSIPVDHDIAAFRKALSISPDVPASYIPLIRVLGAFPYTMSGLRLPVPPTFAEPSPSIECGVDTLSPAWASSSPPVFVHKPVKLPVASVWTLTRIDAAQARLDANSGASWNIECHLAQSNTLIPSWPAEVGANMGVVVDAAAWEAGTPVVFSIPPCSYPFADADAKTATMPEVMRLLESAGTANLHASLLRPVERVAVVTAAVVKKFVAAVTQVSDGTVNSWYLDPRLLAWNNAVLSLNPNLLSINV